MSSKPQWTPQDAWNHIEKAARDDERRRADGALAYIAQQLAATNTTKVNPQVAAVTAAKNRAIDRQDFESAARLRDLEKRVRGGK